MRPHVGLLGSWCCRYCEEKQDELISSFWDLFKWMEPNDDVCVGVGNVVVHKINLIF